MKPELQIAPGTTVYDWSGNEGELVMPHPSVSGYLVHPFYEGIDDETGPYGGKGSITHWSQVFTSPPTQKRNEEVVAIEARLQTLREEVRGLEVSKREIAKSTEADRKLIASLAMRSRVLTNLEKFLDGKITHFVETEVWDRRNTPKGAVSITESANQRCGSEKQGPLKLLTLNGKEPDNLEFYLHTYSDGSGSGYRIVTPCCSYEEARQGAIRISVEQLQAWRDGDKSCLSGVIHNFPLYGMAIPEDARTSWAESQLESKQRAVKGAKDALDKAMQQLDDTEAEIAPFFALP